MGTAYGQYGGIVQVMVERNGSCNGLSTVIILRLALNEKHSFIIEMQSSEILAYCGTISPVLCIRKNG